MLVSFITFLSFCLKVDFSQISMGGPPQVPYRPQQPMQGQFPQVSGPSQPQGPYGGGYQPSPVYQMGQPSPSPVYIMRAPGPAPPMPGMQQYQPPTFEPRREKKIIQIKDPNSNKDVTQEILNRQPSGSLTGSTGGTPNNTTPDISGQSSSSSTPPLTSQQQAEANVRAQFAAQVAATLANNTEEKPRKPEITIQKAPVINKGEADTVQAKQPVDARKEEAAKEIKGSATVNAVTETQSAEKADETQPKEAAVKTQPKEATQGSKISEGVITESTLGSKSLVSSVDATTSANEKISNVRVEIFTADDVRNKESQQSSTAAVSDIVKTEAKVKPSEQTVKQAASDVVPVTETKALNGPVSVTQEEAVEETEEVMTVESQAEVEAPPVNITDTPEPSKTTEEAAAADQQVAEPETTAKPPEEPEVLQEPSEAGDAVGIEEVNGHEGDIKASAAPKNPVETQAAGLYLFYLSLRVSWSLFPQYNHLQVPIRFLLLVFSGAFSFFLKHVLYLWCHLLCGIR